MGASALIFKGTIMPNTKAVGVAYSDPEFESVTVTGASALQTVTATTITATTVTGNLTGTSTGAIRLPVAAVAATGTNQATTPATSDTCQLSAKAAAVTTACFLRVKNIIACMHANKLHCKRTAVFSIQAERGEGVSSQSHFPRVRSALN